MDYELKRYLSKFTALVAELRKKKESGSKIIIGKNQVALEKAKKQKKLPQLFLGNVYGISEQIEKIGVEVDTILKEKLLTPLFMSWRFVKLLTHCK